MSELETEQYHYKSADEIVWDLWKKMPHRDREMSLDSRVEETLTSAFAKEYSYYSLSSYLERKIAKILLPT